MKYPAIFSRFVILCMATLCVSVAGIYAQPNFYRNYTEGIFKRIVTVPDSLMPSKTAGFIGVGSRQFRKFPDPNINTQFPPPPYELIDNFYVAGIDTHGTMRWGRLFTHRNGSYASGAIRLANGDIVVTGQIGFEAVIVRLSSSGTVLQSYTLPLGFRAEVLDVQRLPNGDIVICGHTSGFNADIFVAQFSSDMALQWAKRYGSALNEKVTTMRIMPDGSIVLVGFSGNFGNRSGLLLRLDSQGQILLAKTFTNGTATTLTDVVLADDGYFYASGWVWENPINPENKMEGLFVKLNATFDFVSAVTIGTSHNDQITNLIPYTGNSFLAIGNSNFGEGETDVTVAIVKANGDVERYARFGGLRQNEVSNGFITPNGKIIIAGAARGNRDGVYNAILVTDASFDGQSCVTELAVGQELLSLSVTLPTQSANILAMDLNFTPTAFNPVVTIEDVNAVVGQPLTGQDLRLELTITHESCPGANDGKIEMKAYGAARPVFDLDGILPRQNEDAYTNLSPAVYNVTLTDGATLCSILQYAEVKPAVPLEVSAAVQAAYCASLPNGTATLSIKGGKPPYTIVMDSTTAPFQLIGTQLTGLAATEYKLKVIDANTCEMPFRFVVSDSLLPKVGTADTVFVGQEIRLRPAEPAGGVWLGAGVLDSLTGAFIGTQAGITEVTYSYKSCTAKRKVVVLPPDLTLNFTNIITPNGDNVNDRFEIPKGDFRLVELNIFDRFGNIVYNARGKQVTWSGQVAGNSGGSNPAPDGLYYYTLTFTLLDGREINRSGNITLLR